MITGSTHGISNNTNLNTLPKIVIVDMTPSEAWCQKLRLPPEGLIKVLHAIAYSYPQGDFADGLWYALEDYIEFDKVNVVHLENLELNLEEFCISCDSWIKSHLYPHQEQFRFYKWLAPCAAAFEYRG